MLPCPRKFLALFSVFGFAQVAQAAPIVGTTDGVAASTAQFSVADAPLEIRPTPNYAPIPINIGAPLRLADDGTAILYSNPVNKIYRWRQGVVTELPYSRPTGSRVKYRAANRNGMIVVVLEYTNGQFINGVLVKQFAYVWLPDSTTPVLINVPIARASTWYDQHAEQTLEFKFLDDQNRIWGNVAHEKPTEEGSLVGMELARWDTPTAEPTIIGHRSFFDPSVVLLGVSSGGGEPFGYYAPPVDSVWATGFVPFAGSLTNSLTFVPSQMNSQGWVLGKRGLTPVLYHSGTEYPLPADNSIASIDDRNNLYDVSRLTAWTTDLQTFASTPETPQTPYIAVPMQTVTLPDGYYANWRVAPGDSAMYLDNVTQGSSFTAGLFVPTELRIDANRDGEITPGRWTGAPDRELAERRRSWYFWTNDDDDSGETDGSDIPGNGTNGQDAIVNGTRDLVDFFPLHLDIAPLLRIFPPETAGISYRLVQADGAVNYLLTDLTPVTAGDYQRNAEVARSLDSAPVVQVTAQGVELDRAFLGKILSEGKGVLLAEASKPTTAPLRLEVWREGTRLTEFTLPLSLAGVENMFRHANLCGAVGITPETHSRGGAPNWPDELNNHQAFVFVHGYNVNQQQARGWETEFFKRLWWSGSRAQFWGVTWFGSDSQVPVAHFTPNYQLNVVHALGTAPILADFIRTLRADQPSLTAVNVAGHSLGNMVVSSVISDYQAPIDRYFMIDAAVAAEAYDGAQGDGHVVQPDDGTAFLPHTEWNKERGGVYPSRLWATNWYKLFPAPTGNPATDDGRARLTWRDRFAPQAGTAYYDFHSTGEEVLGYDDNHTEDTPTLAGVLATELKTYLHITRPGQLGQPNGYQTWLYQEQLKGRTTTGKVLGSNYGGWGFNNYILRKTPLSGGGGPRLTPVDMTPEDAQAAEPYLLDSDLQAEPFFRPGGFFTKVGTWKYDPVAQANIWSNEPLRQLYDPANGSAFASRHRDSLLARMIPSMSPAAGRIPVPKLTADAGEERNFDMSSPVIRGNSEPWLSPPLRNDKKWRHSDLREVAYPYVRGLYMRISTLGNLGAAAP